ncbi:signal-regulatory protein delta [Sarotherodon galilaeus]
MAALLIWVEKNVSRTDVECVWKRVKSCKAEEITAKRVSVMTPSTTQAGIERPVSQEDKEWAVASLSKLQRFTGMGWILSPECSQAKPAKTFDEVLRNLGFPQAEDKSRYLLASLAVSDEEKKQIEEATVGQTKNALWSAYRKKRITASNFGLVLSAVQRRSYPPSLFKTLLGQYNLTEGSKACDWGILHEPKAKQLYTDCTGAAIKERGLFLSNSGLLGGSPDGTVSNECIIEVMKCPWSARAKTVLEAAESKDFFLQLDEASGSLVLKKNHNYWHQIQGNLYLTGAKSCHFIVWTPCDFFILHVDREQTWAVNIEALETFYREVFLPHILSQL